MWNFNRIRLSSFIKILVFYLICTSVDTSLTNWPTDSEVMAGQTVRLNCSTSDIYSVNWEHVPTGRTSKNYVYLGGTVIVPYNERFSVEKTDGGSFALVISSVGFRDSGLYRCIDREGQGEQREAQLTVIGSNPRCASEEVVDENSCGIKKQEQALLFCNISYSGNTAPSLNCPDLNVTNIEKNEDKSNQTLVSYRLVVESLPESMESNLNCYTSRSMIPSSPFQFTVSSVVNSTHRLQLSEAVNVTCVANSTGPCSYRWMNDSNDTISFEQTIEINSPGRYQCRASCPLKGIPCDVNCLEVVYVSSEGTNVNLLLAFITLSSLVLILLVIGLVIAVAVRKNQRLKNKENAQFDASVHNCHVCLSFANESGVECHGDERRQEQTQHLVISDFPKKIDNSDEKQRFTGLSGS